MTALRYLALLWLIGDSALLRASAFQLVRRRFPQFPAPVLAIGAGFGWSLTVGACWVLL